MLLYIIHYQSYSQSKAVLFGPSCTYRINSSQQSSLHSFGNSFFFEMNRWITRRR